MNQPHVAVVQQHLVDDTGTTGVQLGDSIVVPVTNGTTAAATVTVTITVTVTTTTTTSTRISSIFKVDATYLSPHVNMAARLETASRQYRVPLLMSHVFHELLSDSVKEKCRQIDCVTVKGSEVPIGIFTYDSYMDQRFLRSEEATMPLTAKTLTRLMSVTNANFMASPSKKMSLLLQTSAASGAGAPGSGGKRGSAASAAGGSLPHRPANSYLNAMGVAGARAGAGAS
eukprot:gene15113-17733_t